METEKIFNDKVVNIIEPFLLNRGFERHYFDKKYVSPQFLYNNKNLWLGISWDWRDFYFESSLGELYEIKDVIPRVIVYGHYDFFLEAAGLSESCEKDLPVENLIETKCAIIIKTFDQIQANYQTLLPIVEKITKERLSMLKLIKKVGI